MKQTAVEWLVEKLEIFATEQEMNIIEQAKEMEKEQKGYSEEDLKEAFKQVRYCIIFEDTQFEDWLEQFKKKIR